MDILAIIKLALTAFRDLISPIFEGLTQDAQNEVYALVDPIIAELAKDAEAAGLTQITYSFASPYLERISQIKRDLGFSDILGDNHEDI
jgi:hypothetical protein